MQHFPSSKYAVVLTEVRSHMNSVDKFANGDFLISARAVKTIYRISGQDGSIVWKLGGKASDFSMDYEFNFQHFARVRSEQDNIVTISLYDNGADEGAPPEGETKEGYEPYSSGLLVSIDTSTNSSHLLERYVSPQHQQSRSMGDLQLLPNGNWYMGMGSIPVAIEFTRNNTGQGQVAFNAELNWGDRNSPAFASYRNFKFPWSATPSYPPDVFAYSQHCGSNTSVYMSWNGATEVAAWRINGTGSSGSIGGGFELTVSKTGFETVANIWPAVMVSVEALDASGTVLSTRSGTQTYVPNSSVAPECGVDACNPGFVYNFANATQCTPVTKGSTLSGRASSSASSTVSTTIT